MKIFISWSGETSHKIAKILRDWLPSVIQSITPYVSSEDIDKGSRWSSDIASELDEASFGVLCVTPDNLNAPWLNFEAGALGKSIDKSRVCPFLFRIKRSDIKGPILQFQSTIHDKDDVFKLIKSINYACGESGIEETRLEKAFSVWWPRLDDELSAVQETETGTEEKKEDPESTNSYISRVLEEVLEISRTNQRLLRDPTSILPPDYFEHIIERAGEESKIRRRIGGKDFIEPAALEDLAVRYKDLLKFIGRLDGGLEQNPEAISEIYLLLRRMDDPIRYISNQLGMRLPREPLENLERDRVSL